MDEWWRQTGCRSKNSELNIIGVHHEVRHRDNRRIAFYHDPDLLDPEPGNRRRQAADMVHSSPESVSDYGNVPAWNAVGMGGRGNR